MIGYMKATSMINHNIRYISQNLVITLWVCFLIRPPRINSWPLMQGRWHIRFGDYMAPWNCEREPQQWPLIVPVGESSITAFTTTLHALRQGCYFSQEKGNRRRIVGPSPKVTMIRDNQICCVRRHLFIISILFILSDTYSSPGWCGSVGWALSCKVKGCWFCSCSGHMPRLQVQSQSGRV